MKHVRKFGWLLVPLALAGCATGPGATTEQQRRADYEAAAGPIRNSFHLFTPIWSWEPLSHDLLVVYTRPKEAWLLDVPGCTNLEFANAIGLTSKMQEVSVGFDKVIVGRGFLPCTITKIRPIDVQKVKDSELARRQVETKPRDEAAPAK